MKFEAYIICWNESAILPFILDYWQRAEVDKLVVYDNHSDDRTLNILKSHSWIEIRDYESGGHANDFIYRDIKNNCWKGSDADWVFVGDTDEVPYAPCGVRHYLGHKAGDAAIIQPCFFNLLSWRLPPSNYGYLAAPLLHQTAGVRVVKDGPNKVNLFRPDRVQEMNYSLGAHKCEPVGAQISYREDIAWLHCKQLGVEYLLERNRLLYDRLPDKVKAEKRIAVHYLPGTDVRNVARDLAEAWAASEVYDKYPVLL